MNKRADERLSGSGVAARAPPQEPRREAGLFPLSSQFSLRVQSLRRGPKSKRKRSSQFAVEDCCARLDKLRAIDIDGSILDAEIAARHGIKKIWKEVLDRSERYFLIVRCDRDQKLLQTILAAD